MASFKIQTVFEDKDLIVIDKPSGLVVNKAESVKGETVQEWMEKKLTTYNLQLATVRKSDFYRRGGVVHRLDKDTSGVMVLAKNERAFINLQRQFKERKVKKTYLALVHGIVEPAFSRLNLPLRRNPFNRQRFGVFITGRPAVTSYLRLGIYQKVNRKFSYLEIKPLTGRTHQIRVHFKHLGHPLVADPLYLGKKWLAEDLNFCPRLFLHSAKLTFFHPEKGKKLGFETELEDNLKKVLKKLRPVYEKKNN